MLLSNIFIFADVFLGSIVFLVGPFRQLSSTLEQKEIIMEFSKRNKGLYIASILAWIWAVLLAGVGIFYIIFIIRSGIDNKTTFILDGILILIILTGGMALSAYGLGKQRKPFNLISIITVTVLTIVLFIFFHGIYSFVGSLLNIAILALVIANWKQFK